MRAVIVSLLAAPLAFAALPALAQSDPSADQIIQSLKPTGNLVGGGTRGIRPATAAAPAADATATTAPAMNDSSAAMKPKSAPKAMSAAMSKPMANDAMAGNPSVDLTVEFASGSEMLTPQARRTLDQLGKALNSRDLANFKFRIEGHTDTVGSPDYNKALSQRRAEAVTAYLERTYSVAPERLEGIGMGEEGLAVSTPTQTPNAQNRRVKVVNLGS